MDSSTPKIYFSPTTQGDEKLTYYLQWMKVDELIEQERQLKGAITSRAGVLGLMLHSTFNHELDDRWQAQRAQQRKLQMAHNQKLSQKPGK